MRTRENRLLPMSCVAAMLVVSSTIVGLAWWVGDAVGPPLASIVQVSTRHDAGTNPGVANHALGGAASSAADRAKGTPAKPATSLDTNIRR